MQGRKIEKLVFGRTAILISTVIYWLEHVFILGCLSVKYDDQTVEEAFYDTIIIFELDKHYLTDFL